MKICHGKLTVDEILKLLGAHQRRLILGILVDDEEGLADITELAAQLAKEGHHNEERAELVLCHHHLPKCADAGVIEYDHRSGAVRAMEKAHDLKSVLDTLEELSEEGETPCC